MLCWISKRFHLIISVLIVVPTAVIYGSPAMLPNHLDIAVSSTDLASLLKAIMGLYLGISFVWILGIWKVRYWKVATQLNILSMLSLAAGRLLSMAVDGLPTGAYVFGIIAELAIGLSSIVQLRRFKANVD